MTDADLAAELRVRLAPGGSATATENAEALFATRPARRPAAWTRRLAGLLVVADLLTTSLAAGAALVWGHRAGADMATPATSVLVGLLLVVAWSASLSLHMSRGRRVLGTGPEEYKRVVTATVRLFGGVAIIAFLARWDLAREYVAVAFPTGLAALVAERWAVRRWLQWRRRRGGWIHRVLVVGSREGVAHLATELAREPGAGFEVVGAWVPDGADVPRPLGVAGRDAATDLLASLPPRTATSLGPLGDVPYAVARTSADTVAVVPSVGITPAALRRLGWALEGSGVDLVVAPSLTDVAGPRVHVRPVAGLPLLHVEEPQYEGPMRVVKGLVDRGAAVVLLLLLAPLLLGIALVVRTTSAGPALFRQERVGRDERRFMLYKFRSMVVDAEARLAELERGNDYDAVMFKMRRDPRVTRVGRWLRRYSLDELPQLLNVLKGEMSLVGPRPPLPTEVASYGSDVRRRLLVKPGMTGLWQVSGRSDLSWQDSVRLDLSYVENWSLTADLVILWKTLAAVLRGAGAY